MKLPPEIEEFLSNHIESVEELEILLLLHRERDRAWDGASVAAELRLSPFSAGERLESLVALGLASPTPQGTRYAATGKTDATVIALARAYQEFRYTILRCIFEKPNARVRTFAEAFRIRKDK